MLDKIYYCTQEDNYCPKKEECKRYTKAENQCQTTLFKVACTEDNNYVLFMKNDEEVKEGDNQ